MDRKLDELLSEYRVKGADKALVDRIVAQAAQLDSRRVGIWRQCAMFAVVAALGFWLGNLQGQKVGTGHAAASTVSATQEQSTGTPGQQILGPDSLSDMML